jgi:SH3 domain protein
MEFFHMKIMNPIGLTVILGFLVFSHTARAETKYVVEHIQVNARTGSSVEHNIVSMLESGQKVQLLEVDKDWSRVKLADGKEGWILSRFLTSSEPRKLSLERLQKKYDELDDQVNALLEENNFLKEQNRIFKSEGASHKEALEEMTRNHQELNQDPSQLMELKASQQEAELKLQELTSKAENLEREIYDTRNQQNIQWFLAGSGVLFLGFLIGLISRRKSRRSSLL